VVKFIGFRPKRRLRKIPKVKYRDNRISKEEQEQPAKVVVIQEDPEDIEEEVRVVSPVYAPPYISGEEEIVKEDSKDVKKPEVKEEVVVEEEIEKTKEETIKVEKEKPKRKKRKYTRRKKKAKTTEVSEPEPLTLPLELSEL
jgi:hypothetical protein